MNDQNDTYRQLAVRDCQGFLWAMYAAYTGLACASFEGKLSSLRLHEIPGASNRAPGAVTESTACAGAALTRHYDAQTSDFWTIPINDETIKALKATLSRSGVLGKHGVVVHTHLTTEQQMIFSACDHFHEECVRVSTTVPLPLLEELFESGVLKHP